MQTEERTKENHQREYIKINGTLYQSSGGPIAFRLNNLFIFFNFLEQNLPISRATIERRTSMKKDRKNKTTFLEVASRVDVLRLVTRSSPRWEETRDKPKNVCVGGYSRSWPCLGDIAVCMGKVPVRLRVGAGVTLAFSFASWGGKPTCSQSFKPPLRSLNHKKRQQDNLGRPGFF